jgi:phage FluMu gp28-like protein
VSPAAAEPITLTSKQREQLKAMLAGAGVHRPFRYQAQRLSDNSRFHLDLWSRQTGKSTTNALDAVFLALQTKESVMCLSASQDLTRELMLKIALCAEAVHNVAGEIQRALRGGQLAALHPRIGREGHADRRHAP